MVIQRHTVLLHLLGQFAGLSIALPTCMFEVGFVASQGSAISYRRFLSGAAVSNEGKPAKFSSAAKANIWPRLSVGAEIP